MATYKKKPATFEAEQFFINSQPWPPGVYLEQVSEKTGLKLPHVKTHDGAVHVEENDWVVTDVVGATNVYNPTDFDAIFELDV